MKVSSKVFYFVIPILPVFSCDVRHDVLVEELQNKGDAIGKHQVLSHVLELRGIMQRHNQLGEHMVQIKKV